MLMLTLATASMSADTLVLRNGQRISGEVVSVRGRVVEFRQSYGWNGTRTVQYDKYEIDRIEFDSGGSSGFDPGGSSRPSGMREREIVVSADVQWNDAGIDVESGQAIYFSATGTVRWGPGRKDGPAGEKNSPYNGNRPIPNRPGAALIGRIGQSPANIFFIGDDRSEFRMRSSGRLFLGINDDVFQDNSQNFRVTVSY